MCLQAGCSIDKVNDLTFREASLLIEAKTREDLKWMRHVRLLAWMQYAANTTDKNKKTPERWMPLPDENNIEKRGDIVDPEQLKKTLEFYSKLNTKKRVTTANS